MVGSAFNSFHFQTQSSFPQIFKMSSMTRRHSPQASKILAIESKSVGSCAITIQKRIRAIRNKSSRVMPISGGGTSSPHVIIHMIHDAGGAKAPMLIYEGTSGGP